MHENDFPIPLESLLATVAGILRGQGKQRELLVLVKAKVVTSLLEYDNWNGGTYTWGLRCGIELQHYGSIREDLDAVSETIREAANYVLRDFQNHNLEQVFIFADAITNPDWRKDAAASLGVVSAAEAEVATDWLALLNELERLLHKRAENRPGPKEEDSYTRVRRQLVVRAEIRDRLPEFVLKSATLASMWSYFKGYSTWHERRDFASRGLEPLRAWLEGQGNGQLPQVAADDPYGGVEEHAPAETARGRPTPQPLPPPQRRPPPLQLPYFSPMAGPPAGMKGGLRTSPLEDVPPMPNPSTQPPLPQPSPSPKRIFKGVDKPKVRNYFETLKLLCFDPWLDEDAMMAGTNLQRGILKGMKESCAVVFFVTPNYVDDKFLATEIDYATDEKLHRGDAFAIVTLVFEHGGQKGKVPDLLRRYVWKEPADDLEGLRVILRALPVKVGPVG